MRSRGSEKLFYLLKEMQQVSQRAKIQARVCPAPKPGVHHCHFTAASHGKYPNCACTSRCLVTAHLQTRAFCCFSVRETAIAFAHLSLPFALLISYPPCPAPPPLQTCFLTSATPIITNGHCARITWEVTGSTPSL